LKGAAGVKGASILGFAYVLCHVPDLVRYGSKPSREPELRERLASLRRGWDHAVAYPPHQVYIGGLSPRGLADWPTPWWRNPVPGASPVASWGRIVPQEEFYRLLQAADVFDLVRLDPDADPGPGGLRLFAGGEPAGCIRRGHEEDEDLRAGVLLENLAAKASGALALRLAVQRAGVDPAALPYVLSCGEEAVGDRYQRGAGNLAKAMAELAGCTRASGADVKAFCCGPVHSLVMAAALVASGLHETVAVAAGGSLAKLGMKSRGHVAHAMPVLEDVLAGAAFVVGPAEPGRPLIRLDAVGRHRVGSGSSQQAILTDLVVEPLERLGRRITDVDRFAPELHNPELTEPAGSGNVPRTNYRMIGSLAVARGDLAREGLERFEAEHGLPGWSPTQGHIASGIPYLGHACEALARGEIGSALIMGKGSLFLGKMTRLSDGCSFVLENA
jgi:hypothetical protein